MKIEKKNKMKKRGAVNNAKKTLGSTAIIELQAKKSLQRWGE